jgi:hypothetical protein
MPAKQQRPSIVLQGRTEPLIRQFDALSPSFAEHAGASKKGNSFHYEPIMGKCLLCPVKVQNTIEKMNN